MPRHNMRTTIVSGVVTLCFVAFPLVAQVPLVATPLELKAVEFVGLIRDGNYDKLPALMDATMNGAMSPDQFAQLWKTLESQAGTFQSIESTRRQDAQGFAIAIVTCAFERVTLDLQVTYDDDRLVAGFFVRPAAQIPEPITPDYADREAFIEEETQVVTGEYVLPATLAVPKSGGDLPVVVLVHGSGPNDRDETIGPNKVFRDLAWGLASRGIASLRYDKRTKVYRSKLNIESLTHREEVVDDALSAIAMVSADPRFDSRRVVLVGHSLGGTLAPLIASETSRLAGIVILAGSNRSIFELILEQFDYIFMKDGRIDDNEQEHMDDLRRSIADIKSGKPIRGILAGAGLRYYEELEKIDPIAIAANLTMPILIAQGERDYQVSAAKDFERWKRGLERANNVRFQLYPALDHLFMAGDGPSWPEDYATPRNVSPDLIQNIAAFISKLD